MLKTGQNRRPVGDLLAADQQVAPETTCWKVGNRSLSTTPVRTPRGYVPPTFDDSTLAGRRKHWLTWLALDSQWRDLIDLPPCLTCGRRPLDTPFRDGSPRFARTTIRA